MRLSNCAAAAVALAFLAPPTAVEVDWPKVAAALGKSISGTSESRCRSFRL